MRDPLTASSYDEIAERYAARVDDAPYNAHYERPAMLAALPDIRGKHIVDAGCGNGWYMEQLLDRGAKVTAFDSSKSMLIYARRRLLQNEIPESRATLHLADFSRPLDFLQNESVDGIVSALALHYIRDWRPALTEFRRVLRPDGWLLFSTHHPCMEAVRLETPAYFTTELVEDEWKWMGKIRFFRRSLTEITSSLMDSGFLISRLFEPTPTERFRQMNPAGYRRLMSKPEFLLGMAIPAR